MSILRGLACTLYPVTCFCSVFKFHQCLVQYISARWLSCACSHLHCNRGAAVVVDSAIAGSVRVGILWTSSVGLGVSQLTPGLELQGLQARLGLAVSMTTNLCRPSALQPLH